MTEFVITVEFVLKPGAQAAFLPLIRENAVRSLNDEPGCRRFDVLVPEGFEDRVLLYEIYDDELAFAEHCRSAHFHAFDRDSAGLVVSKTVQRLARLNGAPGWQGDAEDPGPQQREEVHGDFATEVGPE